MLTNECWACKGISSALCESLRYSFTQALQIPEPFATAYAHVVLGARSLIDCVSMDYDCRGQRLPIRSVAWLILFRMGSRLPKVSPNWTLWIRQHGISSFTITYEWFKVGFFTELAYHLANIPETGLSSHERFAIQVINPPATLSWLPIKLAHGERELLDHCK